MGRWVTIYGLEHSTLMSDIRMTLNSLHLTIMDNQSHRCEAIGKTRAVADYMKRLFDTEITDWPRVPMPNWSLHVLQEVHNMVHIVKQAVRNESEHSVVQAKSSSLIEPQRKQPGLYTTTSPSCGAAEHGAPG